MLVRFNASLLLKHASDGKHSNQYAHVCRCANKSKAGLASEREGETKRLRKHNIEEKRTFDASNMLSGKRFNLGATASCKAQS